MNIGHFHSLKKERSSSYTTGGGVFLIGADDTIGSFFTGGVVFGVGLKSLSNLNLAAGFDAAIGAGLGVGLVATGAGLATLVSG